MLDKFRIESLHCQVASSPIHRGIWIKWHPPDRGMYKLNIDGSSVNGKCSGGGILRDHTGSMIAAFSNFYGDGSNMTAEANALKDGLMLCAQLNLQINIVESDSLVAVQALQTNISPLGLSVTFLDSANNFPPLIA